MSARPLGRRIVIYGVTGSGKTTLARALATRLGLLHIELDAIRHDGGWDATPFDQMYARLAVKLAAANHGWVCEGNYRQVRGAVLPHADTVIWVRLPWRQSFTQLLRRTLARAWTRERLYTPNGPHESLRVAFFDRRSILWWAIHHHKKTQRSIEQALRDAPADAEKIVLRSRAELNALLDAVDSACSDPG